IRDFHVTGVQTCALPILSRQFGQQLTRDQAKALGIENQVIAQLVAGVVLDEQARKMQLGLSKDGIARLTAEDPSFHDASGNFNRNQFNAVLRQAGIRPEDYLTGRAEAARRQQIVEAATDGIKIPDTMRSEEHTSELQSRENLVCRLLL